MIIVNKLLKLYPMDAWLSYQDRKMSTMVQNTNVYNGINSVKLLLALYKYRGKCIKAGQAYLDHFLHTWQPLMDSLSFSQL